MIKNFLSNTYVIFTGYINEAGELNLSRFEKYIASLSHVEHKIFESAAPSKICNTEEAKIADAIKSEFERLFIESEQEVKSKNYSNFEVQRRDYYLKKLKFKDVSEYDLFKWILRNVLIIF